jgi:4-alpha-glucanotransferase
VWADRDAFCLGLSIGAPPDALNANGQNWGLPPLNPRVLRERAYAPFAAVLRANMQYAGALRIDHVMGLMRLFVIPEDASPKDGAYLEYPFEDLAGVLALESMQNRCMVVGEDLGTLPEGFRDRMHARRFFSTRLLYFEREDDGTFYDPSRYPHYAVASTGTHDLPPLAGFWRSLGKRDRMQLRELLGGEPENDGDLALVTSSYRTLARTNAALLLLQLEDALLQLEAVNVPGTTVEAPNWRRKLPVAVDVLQDDARFATIVAELREARSRARSE